MSDLVWTPIKIKLGQIIPWSDNPRMSTKAQAQRLIKSERELGQIQTLAVSPFEDGRVYLYDGHQRCAAWMTVKDPSYEITALQSNRMLTDDERRKVSVLLHTATGSWSWEALSSWSAADLREWGMDEDTLKGWNNDANNLKELLKSETVEPVDAEPQIDRAAELAEKWQTKSGQLWKLGEHRLLIGDCTVRENVERLMGGERAEFCFTDPPYGVKYTGGTKKWAMLENDDEVNMYAASLPIIYEFTTDKAALYCAFASAKARSVYTAFAENNYEQRALIIWNKNHAQFGSMGSQYKQKHEPIAYCFKSGQSPYWFGPNNEVTVWDVSRESANEFHPTQKPPELYMRAMKNSAPPNCLIFEPFAGSGTAFIAAHNLNRRCYAMEISEKYGAVILERFQTATGITPELTN